MCYILVFDNRAIQRKKKTFWFIFTRFVRIYVLPHSFKIAFLPLVLVPEWRVACRRDCVGLITEMVNNEWRGKWKVGNE